jgi:hypothetical protein
MLRATVVLPALGGRRLRNDSGLLDHAMMVAELRGGVKAPLRWTFLEVR